MVMIAVVTALAMRLPNPRMVAIDFLYGTLAALPLGTLYFLVIMPATQQSMLLLCISLAAMAFFIGIEVQKRRLGSLGALASTINILVLDNPMQFQFSQFLDSALGKIVGCFLALMVILIVRDTPGQNRSGAAEPVCLRGGLFADHQLGASQRESSARALSAAVFITQ